MATFVKAQASSLISTLVDFTMTIVLGHLHVHYLVANFTGTVSGGVTNFLLGRFWAFDARRKKAPKQAVRYFLVWVGNLLLNNGGVFIFVHFFHLGEIVSKIIVSLVVGIGYNYFMQKKFVFA